MNAESTEMRPVLLKKVRLALTVFVTGLILSGLTAFPLEWEMDVLAKVVGVSELSDAAAESDFVRWIRTVRDGLKDTYAKYPFIAYGTDWLAFAHLVLAILFIGAMRDPVRNLWVITFGLIACVLVFPLALLCGPIRGIPFYWRLIDSSFGVLGFIPLWFARKWVCQIQELA